MTTYILSVKRPPAIYARPDKFLREGNRVFTEISEGGEWVSVFQWKGVLKVEIAILSLCRITDINGDEWANTFRKAMFPISRREYPFLRRRLMGDWWLCKAKLLQGLSDGRISAFGWRIERIK